jgi:hypothetical protein
MVGDPGVEPGLPCSQSRRVTVSLASGGEVRNRTGSPTLARRGRCLTCHPQSGPPRNRTGNLRPAEAALCQLELAAHRGAAPGTGLSPGVAGLSSAAPHQMSRQDGACRRCSRYGNVKKQARSPAGGASQGREDSNPRRAVLEAAVLAAELRPYVYKRRTARRKSPRAVPGDSKFGLYPGTSAMRRASVAHGWLYQSCDSFACLNIVMSEG